MALPESAPTAFSSLSLHDALPILPRDGVLHDGEAEAGAAALARAAAVDPVEALGQPRDVLGGEDRKSTRLNSSHSQISYAVFCMKKKPHRQSPCPLDSMLAAGTMR